MTGHFGLCGVDWGMFNPDQLFPGTLFLASNCADQIYCTYNSLRIPTKASPPSVDVRTKLRKSNKPYPATEL
eukprot:5974040-Ditylum_brightwellii.AAC.1